MKLIASSIISLVTASVAFAGSPVLEKEVVVEPDPNWGSPILGGGVKANSELVDGSFFLVYPFMNSIGQGGTMEGSTVFFEPYVSWGDGGDVGVSLGLGFRHLFSNQTVQDALTNTNPGFLGEGVFVGGNLFLDYGRSVNANNFWQGGIGLEAGTRYLEVRGNFYLPLSDEQSMGRFTQSSVSQSTSSSSRRTLGGPPVFRPLGPPPFNPVAVFRPSTVNTTSTTRTTTQTTTFEIFEEALEGWDLEVALLVPGLDQYMDLKLVGGVYSFSGDRSSADFEGWRAGAELRPVPAVVIHGTWFETEDLYGDSWLAGVRFELPLEGIGNSFRSRRRHLAERLFEPVHRKNSAITTSGPQTDPVNTSQNTTLSSSTSTTSGPLTFVRIIGGPFRPIRPPGGGGDTD